ncbi:MAG: preprotein translocase subunit SecG [Bacteroidota bacterium]
MFLFIAILIIIACVFLTLVVLIQNPKGGGIAANFIAPQQIMGAKRSTDVVEKATWILAVILISFSLLSNFFRPTGESETATPESRLKENIENTATPAAPAPQQQAQPAQQQPAAQPATK